MSYIMPHLIEQKKLNNLVCEYKLCEQGAELLGSRLIQLNLLARGIKKIPVLNQEIALSLNILKCRIQCVCVFRDINGLMM